MNPRLALVARPRWGCHLRRTLFTLPDPFSAPFFPGSSDPPDVQNYQEQKILPCVINRLTPCAELTARSYKPAQLYAVVADVARYPRFVPFCTGARILRVLQQHQQSVTDMEAELTVGFLAFKESYVSRVTCRPFESVKVHMVLLLVRKFIDDSPSRRLRPPRRHCSGH
jgi:coenzyme Q-binding protein COQ10